ncbi:hypothetical protein HYZ05_01110 [Candidatus Daviesbacteria bacterium]|nr:hypothetical protein [Candidatus Daviesbacteria bacterium]
MMRKEKGVTPVVIVLSIALVVALAGVGYFYLQTQKSGSSKDNIKTAKDVPPPKREAPTPLVAQPPADQMVYKTFKSADSQFSFDYPVSWTQIDIKNLESIVPKEMIDKNELKMPLLLTDPTGGRLVFSTYRFDSKMDLDQVMDSLKADSERMGAPYEEISRKTEEESLVVDAKIRAGGVIVMNRDIVFMVADSPTNSVYVISLASPENVWTKFETIFAKVQSSAKLTVSQ